MPVGKRPSQARVAFILGLLLLALVVESAPVFAASPLPGWPADAQSTTGPRPARGLAPGARLAEISSPHLVPGVPAYNWFNGCGPTAAGMLIGYWDGQGFDDLVVGDASSQTPDVEAMISSTGTTTTTASPSTPGLSLYCPTARSHRKVTSIRTTVWPT